MKQIYDQDDGERIFEDIEGEEVGSMQVLDDNRLQLAVVQQERCAEDAFFWCRRISGDPAASQLQSLARKVKQRGPELSELSQHHNKPTRMKNWQNLPNPVPMMGCRLRSVLSKQKC